MVRERVEVKILVDKFGSNKKGEPYKKGDTVIMEKSTAVACESHKKVKVGDAYLTDAEKAKIKADKERAEKARKTVDTSKQFSEEDFVDAVNEAVDAKLEEAVAVAVKAAIEALEPVDKK